MRVEVGRAEPGGEFLCIATILPLRRWRDIISFLRMSSRVEKQLKETEGLVRYGLRANLLRKEFWTFSVWADKPSVNAFVHSGAHTAAVERFPDWAGEGAAFVEWNSSDGVINWKDAAERVKNPSFYYRGAGR
jgi:heme-degrading monooxygenase HmoA